MLMHIWDDLDVFSQLFKRIKTLCV